MKSEERTDARVDYVTIPPDGGWGWFVVFIAFVWNMVIDGTGYTFAIFIHEMMPDFHVEQSLMMVASSVQMGVYFLLGPFVAAMINRLGFRVVSIMSGVLSFAALLAAAYIENIYIFIAVFGGALGTAFAMAYLCNILVVGFYFAKYRAVATCIAATGNPVGVSVFPCVLTVLVPDVGWREKYKYLSGAHLLMALCAFVYRPVPISEIIVTTEGKSDDSTSSIWDEWEREHPIKGISDFPTNADLLANVDYTVNSPYENRDDSGTSFRSTRTTTRSIRGKSVSSFRPMSMADVPKYSRRKVCCCRCKCKLLLCSCLWHDHRPMYRDDILYHGSTARLPQYSDTGETDYNMKVTRTSHLGDTPENADCCNCCPASVIRVLTTMFGFSLLRSCAFCLLCFSGFLTYLGLYAPYMLGIEVSMTHDIAKVKASYVLTAIGVSNGVGRIFYGVLATLIPKWKPIIISEVTLIIAGAAVIAHPFFSSFIAHLVCACIFGLNIATISSLRTLVVVDLLGLEKLTNAFGLIVLLEGLSSFVAMPLNAYLRQVFNDLRAPFIFGGAMIILSGIVLIPVPSIQRWDVKQGLKREARRRSKQYEEAKRIATAARPRAQPAPQPQPAPPAQPTQPAQGQRRPSPRGPTTRQ